MRQVNFFLVLFFNFNSQNRPLSSSILVSLSPPANMYDLVCIELDYHRAQYCIERDTLLFIRIILVFWATEVEFTISSTNNDSYTISPTEVRVMRTREQLSSILRATNFADHFSFLGDRGRVHDFEHEQRLVYDFTIRGPCYANSRTAELDHASHQLWKLVPSLRSN